MAEEQKLPQPNDVIEQKQGIQIIFLGNSTYFYNIDRSILDQGIWKIIEFIMGDDDLEEVMYDGPDQPVKVYHRKYGMCDTSVTIDINTINAVIQWIAQYNKKTIDQNNPILDGVMYDGSRVNITVPPASPKYPTITIRKFKQSLITILDLIDGDSISAETAAFLWTAIEGLGYKPANMLVVGGTGTGKTTFLNAISMLIPKKSRIVTIEDTPELKVKHANLLTMVSKKEQRVTMDMLLKNALRQRPDRIMVGEVRGPEAVTLFNAMNTGHDGCMGTVHANSARESIDRVTNPPMNVPPLMVNALDLVVVLKRLGGQEGGKRVIGEITEVSASGGTVQFNQIFLYDAGKGTLVSTGIPSRLREKLSKLAGIEAKDFDFLIQDRTKIIKRLVELNKEKPFSENELFDIIDKNTTHWKDEKAKKFFERVDSWIKRIQKKEDVLYL